MGDLLDIMSRMQKDSKIFSGINHFDHEVNDAESRLKANLVKNLCSEVPVQVLYNGREASVLLCTPDDLIELAVGWLYSQGLIEDPKEINSLGICDDKSQVFIRTDCDRWIEKKGWRKALSSGCGGGAMLVSALKQVVKPIATRLPCTTEEIKRNMQELIGQGELYKETGGMHSACLANGKEGILHLSEDIGRHNAVDKVIGKGLTRHLDFSEYYLLTTGRISAEIVLKATRAGIPSIASLSIVSTLALEIAFLAGISLIGRALSKSPIVYTEPIKSGCNQDRITT